MAVLLMTARRHRVCSCKEAVGLPGLGGAGRDMGMCERAKEADLLLAALNSHTQGTSPPGLGVGASSSWVSFGSSFLFRVTDSLFSMMPLTQQRPPRQAVTPEGLLEKQPGEISSDGNDENISFLLSLFTYSLPHIQAFFLFFFFFPCANLIQAS